MNRNKKSLRSNRATGNIALHIERLVLEGVPLSAGQTAQLERAVQHELARLLQRDGMNPSLRGTAVPTLVAPSIEISTPFRPAGLGRQIARSVLQSLTRKI